jgi:hypothetical protein
LIVKSVKNEKKDKNKDLLDYKWIYFENMDDSALVKNK